MNENNRSTMGPGLPRHCRYAGALAMALFLASGCTAGIPALDFGSIDLNGAFDFDFHSPLAVPGGPYSGVTGQPVQFDGSASTDAEGHTLTYSWNLGDGSTSAELMPIHTYAEPGSYVVTLEVCDDTACNLLVSSTTADIRPAADASPGGIWTGVDADGAAVLVIATEAGRFHFVDALLSQGSGTLIVSNGNDLDSNFLLTPEYGFAFDDETTIADCTLTGTLVERQSMSVVIDCVTSAGLAEQTLVALDYESQYERHSSLATISGMYTDGSAHVLDISAEGFVFGQHADSGCVVNGSVQLIYSSYGLYNVGFTIQDCTGEDAVLNGADFTGLAALDDSASPELLFIAATGDLAGTPISIVIAEERL